MLKSMAIFAATCSLVMAENNWNEDFEVAKAAAAKEKKLILMNVTGSAACDRSAISEKEIFSQKKFQEFAKENLILFNLDFPNAKPQDVKIEKQHEELAKKLKLLPYSDFMLLDAEGNKIDPNFTSFGSYGSADKVVEVVKELLAKRKK
jgi:thioredoxin-related protein